MRGREAYAWRARRREREVRAVSSQARSETCAAPGLSDAGAATPRCVCADGFFFWERTRMGAMTHMTHVLCMEGAPIRKRGYVRGARSSRPSDYRHRSSDLSVLFACVLSHSSGNRVDSFSAIRSSSPSHAIQPQPNEKWLKVPMQEAALALTLR